MINREQIQVGSRTIGSGAPCYVIAEAGVNHNGDIELALELVERAAQAGADAVKFQTFEAEDVISAHAPKADYQKAVTPSDESQLEMAKKLQLPDSDFRRLAEHCAQVGIQFLSTPFDLRSAQLLCDLGVPALKVASGELTNLPFLAGLARLDVPLLVSTGMATLGEVERALQSIYSAAPDATVALFHCVSSYPAPPEAINLRAMTTLRAAFGVPVGFSDHTMGTAIPLAAVAQGASMLEKHFTLDCTMEGPDHQASLEPEQLSALVQDVRAVEAALGDGRKRPADCELNTREVARRSIILNRDLAEGARIESDHLALKRPGTGLGSEFLEHVVGRRLRTAQRAGTVLTWSMLQ